MAQVSNGAAKKRLVQQLDPDHHSHLPEDAVALPYLHVNADSRSTSLFLDQHGHGGRCSHAIKCPSAMGAKNSTQNATYCHKNKLRVIGQKDYEKGFHRTPPPAHETGDSNQNASTGSEMDSDSNSEEENDESLSMENRIGVSPAAFNMAGYEEKKKWEMPKLDFLHVCFLVINLFFIVIGTLLLALGLVLIYNSSGFSDFTKSIMSGRLANVDFVGVFAKGTNGFIISGVITIVLGLIGTVGVTANSIIIMHMYAGLICGAIAIQIIGLLYGFLRRGEIFDEIKSSLLSSMKKQYDGLENSSSLFSQSMDAAQVYFECCGITGWRDFKDTPWYKRINSHLMPTTSIPCYPEGADTSVSPFNTTTPNSTDGAENVTRAIKRTTPCVKTTTTPHPMLADNADEPTTPKEKIVANFPRTCCKTLLGAVLSLTEGNMQLQDAQCPYKNATPSNPNTGIGCFDTVKTFLFNQVVVIVSLIFTIIGVQVSAVSNALSVIKLLKKKADKGAKGKGLGAIPGASFIFPGMITQNTEDRHSSDDSNAPEGAAIAPPPAGAMYVIGPTGQPQLVFANPGVMS